MKSLPGFIARYAFRPWLERYLSKQRTYRYANISIQVLPGVFHPGFYFSSKYLIQHLLQFNLDKKSVLELGAGTGLLSFIVEQHGAKVTASDLGTKAIENLLLNKSLLHSNVEVVHSDLFDTLPVCTFDFIVINPPYYPKQPGSDAALAWYCGAHFEYFEKLFSELAPFMHAATNLFMVLSEECDLVRIESIARANKFRMQEASCKKFWGESNYIFEVVKN
ncbi:MAG: methyltransferase [Chitinophagales bacterium]